MSTFNEIVYDILETVRGNSISDDTEISEDHIIYNVNLQRALFLRNELNKPGRQINPQIEQDLGCLELITVDAAECCSIKLDCYVLRTKKKLPKFLELHSGPAITRVGPIHKTKLPFTFTNYNKAVYSVGNTKYSKGVYAFLLNDYIYVLIADPAYETLEYINVRGIVADPLDMLDYICDNNGTNCFSMDDNYPISNWMLPYIKEPVLNQYGMSLKIPKDTSNDANEKLEKQ